MYSLIKISKPKNKEVLIFDSLHEIGSFLTENYSEFVDFYENYQAFQDSKKISEKSKLRIKKIIGGKNLAGRKQSNKILPIIVDYKIKNITILTPEYYFRIGLKDFFYIKKKMMFNFAIKFKAKDFNKIRRILGVFMKEYLSKKEVAELLGVTTQTVYNLYKTGKLKAFKTGKARSAAVLIKKEDLEDYINNLNKI